MKSCDWLRGVQYIFMPKSYLIRNFDGNYSFALSTRTVFVVVLVNEDFWRMKSDNKTCFLLSRCWYLPPRAVRSSRRSWCRAWSTRKRGSVGGRGRVSTSPRSQFWPGQPTNQASTMEHQRNRMKVSLLTILDNRVKVYTSPKIVWNLHFPGKY